MKKIFFLVLLIISQITEAQQIELNALKELRIKTLKAETDGGRQLYNRGFDSLLNILLTAEGAFDVPLDSVPKIGILYSDDEKIKIINWNVPLADEGKMVYYAYVIKKLGKKQSRVYPLFDGSDYVSNPDKKVLAQRTWYGALYYDIVVLDAKAETYALLGWDGAMGTTNTKLIDILWFNGRGDLQFGKAIFDDLPKTYPERRPVRWFMRYASDVTVSMTYQPKSKLIVFDKLAPMHEHLEGFYEFYGPTFQYNGFELKNGRLGYVEDVEFLGPASGKPWNDPTKKEKP